jgi:hypothetical protein
MGIKDWFNRNFDFRDLEEKKENKNRTEKSFPIETKDWIRLSYSIILTPDKKFGKNKDKEREETIGRITLDLHKIILNLARVIKITNNGEAYFLGHSNPLFEGRNIIFDPNAKKSDQLINQPLSRGISISFDKKGEGYQILLRAKNKSKSKAGDLIDVSKQKNKVYGYSPIDFANDLPTLFELDEELWIYFKDIHTEEPKRMFRVNFNEEKEPIITFYERYMVIEYNMKDRIKLKEINPDLELRCFNLSIEELIKYLRKQKTFDEHSKKWVEMVERLIKENK